MKYYKCSIFLMVVLILIFNGCFSQSSENINIAKNKKYSFSVKPNYKNTQSNSDTHELTDGKFTNGFFWTQPTTVGWNHVSKVTISLDLETINNISSVGIRTARGEKSQVNFPKNILLYGSKDNQSFFYIGDIATDPNNTNGDYNVETFKLNDLNEDVRYLKFVIIPDGRYFFTDEILVNKSKGVKTKSNSTVRSKNFNVKDLDVEVDNQISSEAEIARSKRILSSNSTGYRGSSDIVAEKDKIIEEKVKELKNKFRSSILLERASPWDNIVPEYFPNSNSKDLKINVNSLTNYTHFEAFTISNLDNSDKKLNLSFNSKSNFSLFEAQFVHGSSASLIPDALVPINVSNPVSINKNSTKLFIIKLKPIKQGVNTNIINITDNKSNQKITIVNNTKSPSINKISLNSNVWAYFFYPMLENLRNEALTDLKNHHINTFVLPQSVMPKINNLDFSKTINYLKGVKSIDNILIFNNFANKDSREPQNFSKFLSAQWKTSFKQWFIQLKKELGNHNIHYNNIYLYPFDEIKNANVDDFIAFSKWIKSEIPGAKIYVTLDEVKIKNQIEDYVDVGQLAIGVFSNEFKFDKNNSKWWIYNTKGNARNLSPNSYYRIQGWQAFYYGFTGVGFWNYADIAKNETVNRYTSTVLNNMYDYSVIYNDINSRLISSRRWEAFSLGIEEYNILKMYSLKHGESNTRNLIKIVLNDNSQFDKIRRDIINSL